MTSSPTTLLTLALLVGAILVILWLTGRRHRREKPGVDTVHARDVADAGQEAPEPAAIPPVTAMAAPAAAPVPPPSAAIPSVSVPPVTAAPVPAPAAPKPVRKAKPPKPEAPAEPGPAKAKTAPKPQPKAKPVPAPVADVPKAAAITAIGIPGAVGAPDDLLVLKGVGPKLGALLTALEITRFDQIAAWGPAETATVDDHLGAFKGRIARDAWVEQAGFLARGDIAGYEAKFGKLEGGG